MRKPLFLKVARRFPNYALTTAVEAAREPKKEGRKLPRWVLSWKHLSPLTAGIPWVSFEAFDYLEKFLADLDHRARIWEYGSGGSTVWFAQHSESLDGVEHDPVWHALVTERVKQKGISNCHIALIEQVDAEPPFVEGTHQKITYGTSETRQRGDYSAYVKAIDHFDDEYFDLVVIDGRSREACLIHAASKVRRGGAIYLDDADRPRYQSTISLFADWKQVSLGGIRPLSSPNRGLILIRPTL